MKKILALLFAVVLAGCASVTKVEGEQVLEKGMTVTVDSAWNRYVKGSNPFELWTQEGPTVDHLRIWPGIASGSALAIAMPVRSGQKELAPPKFVKGMSADQLVSLFETVYAMDGSTVKVLKIEPATFAGESGVRFEFAVTRKSNDLQLRGMGWAAVRKDELYAATFLAPELSFYKKLLPKAEKVAASVRIKS